MTAYRAGVIVPEHERLVTSMLDAFAAEMQDPAAKALINEIRGDLRRLSGMSVGEVEEFLPRHAERVSKLVRMHEAVAQGR